MEENRSLSAFRRYRYAGLLAVSAVLFAAALVASLRLAYAGILEQEGDLARAAALDPWNARYHAALADLLERRGLDPEPELALACRLDPRHAAYWMRRAIRAETHGRIGEARRYYLEAARIDRQFAPRIALMNFYFRQGDAPEFWTWARRSFERSYGDRSAAFQLCWLMNPDAGAIVDRTLPHDAEILRQFLAFVADRAGPRQALPVACALLGVADAETGTALLGYCDRLQQAGLWDDAKAVWDEMARRGLAPAKEPDNLLTNPQFRSVPSGRGFDWKLFPAAGAGLTPGDPELGFSVSFSGNQPEACPLIEQIVEIPEASLAFRMEYRTSDTADNGLSVVIDNAVAGESAAPLARAGLAPAPDWTVFRLAVNALQGGSQSRFARLALRYRRKPGTVRYCGRVEFRRLRLSGNSGANSER
ncbi:MAG: tetratricopeptide repeat protein [Bryobacteraceae bacterium]